MNDLVQKLRELACRYGGQELYESRVEWIAADEIERLNHHIEEHQYLDGLQQMEIDRLRAALEKYNRMNGAELLDDYGEIAREALKDA